MMRALIRDAPVATRVCLELKKESSQAKTTETENNGKGSAEASSMPVAKIQD